ncbi:MAG: hypothetical protein HQL77_02450 [Magnetococcales bacterium]|nr:hypothetical protein [Magnetococcales bacterium]
MILDAYFDAFPFIVWMRASAVPWLMAALLKPNEARLLHENIKDFMARWRRDVIRRPFQPQHRLG